MALTIMFNPKQPRDEQGRFRSRKLADALAVVDLPPAIDALEEELESGTSDSISEAADCLVAAIDRVSRLTPTQAEQISGLLKTREAQAMPTPVWLRLDGCCRQGASPD